jgi:hypothetical protein
MQQQPTPENFVKTLKLDVATHGMTWGMKVMAARKQSGVVCSLAEWGEGITRQYLPGRTWRNPVIRTGVTTYRDLVESLGLAVHIKDGKPSDWLNNDLLGAFGVAPIQDLSLPVSEGDAAKLGLAMVPPETIEEVSGTDVTPKDQIGVEIAMALHLGKKQSPAAQVGTAATPSGGACFVATAVFGDPFAPEVCLLRMWRDTILRRNPAGRLGIRAYGILGPLLSRIVTRIPGLRRFTRSVLCSFIRRVAGPAVAPDTSTLDR